MFLWDNQKENETKKERLQLPYNYTPSIYLQKNGWNVKLPAKWHQAGHEECTFHWQHAQCTKLQQDQANDLFELEEWKGVDR